MANVTINGPGVVTGSFNYTDPRTGETTTFYGWTFGVTVDGQVGVYTVYIDSNTDEAAAAADALQDLQDDPGALGGIVENDDGRDQGDQQDSGQDGADGDDDGVLADGEGSGGTGGESV